MLVQYKFMLDQVRCSHILLMLRILVARTVDILRRRYVQCPQVGRPWLLLLHRLTIRLQIKLSLQFPIRSIKLTVLVYGRLQ